MSITNDLRRANAEEYMQRIGAPMTRENLTRLAKQYETAYRRHRASKNPPIRRLLHGEIATARAFYSLARRAEQGGLDLITSPRERADAAHAYIAQAGGLAGLFGKRAV